MCKYALFVTCGPRLVARWGYRSRLSGYVKRLTIGHLLSTLLVSMFLLTDGCGSSDKPKFTEEELALIPFAQRTGLPEASGGFALVVGGETITSDEIVEPLAEYFRASAQTSSFEQFEARVRPQVEQLLVTRVSNILLYNQAKKDAGEQIDEALEKMAEAEVRRFIVSFENDYAKAEKALKEMGMDWASFKEDRKRWILSQNYIFSQMPDYGPVTYSELIDYYNDIKEEFFSTPATLEFRLIDIEAAKLEVTDASGSRLEQARELANELLGRLQAGEDFGELALKYSHGHRRMFGGLWKPVQPESLAEPYDILADEAEKMEPGQIAGPIEAGGHIFIMKLEGKQQASVEPFEKVQREVEAEVILNRRKRAHEEVAAKFMQQAALDNEDEFIDFCVEKIYRAGNR